MNKSAILHIPMSQYAFGIREDSVCIRLRAAHNDIKECFLYFGDRACRLTPVIFTEVKMKIVAKSPLHDYFEVVLENPYKRLCYYFELNDGKEKILYYGDTFCKEPVDDRSEYFQLPFNHRADLVSPPDWAKNAIIYNIFPDSFATSKNFISQKATEVKYKEEILHGKLGGTINGIRQNIDYLKDLGVNAIYINPIFAAGEYHKYDLIDYYQIDPAFGNNEDFKELVKELHSNGIKVIIDGVFNHCGWHFFAFDDVVKNGEKSKYKDWFYGLNFPVIRPDNWEDYPNYECFGYERMMPKLNTANKEVRDYFCSVGKYWVENYDTDGWRLDVASEVNDDFWREFNREVKRVKPDAIMIGEIWESANHWLDGKIFDSAMNYDFRKHCKRFFAEKSIDASEFDGRVTDMRMRYRTQTVYSQLNVLDTHDVSRFISVCLDDRERYKLAVIFQMTFPGMPSIFYGDELGISGVLENEYRQPMPWGKEDELFDFYKRLINIRKQEEALRFGEYVTLTAKEGSFLYGYERKTEKETIRVLLNVGENVDVNKYVNNGKIIASYKLEDGHLDSYGYLLLKL